jgi:hypothetical protein
MSTLFDGSSALGLFRNDINNLLNVSENCYENIFRMYTTTDNQYFYNLLNNVCLPVDISPSYFYVVKISRKTAWTVISYNEYKTMNLWWLICIVNNIQNPIDYPVPGTQLKIIYPQYVKTILDEINSKINL